MARETGRPVTAIVSTVVAGLVVVATIVIRHDKATERSAEFSRFERAAEVSPLPGEIGIREGWNSSAFINDNLWTEGDFEFAVWADAEGDPIVGRRHGAEPDWQTFDLASLPGNPLHAPTAADPHNVYAIGVDEAGYVHVAGNMHGNPLRYVRSQEPFGIDEWIRPPMVVSDESAVSYPAFVRAPGGTLLFFYRDGTAGRGDVLVNDLDVASGSWRQTTLIDGRSSDESPYLQRIAVDSVRRSIHLMFLWRAGDEAETNRDVSYLRSDDGGTTWRSSDNGVVRLPVTHGNADVVGRTTDGSPHLLNQGALAVDENGRPHAVFRVLTGTGSPSGSVHVWQEPDGWRSEPLTGLTSMAGRPALVGAGREPLLMLWSEREGDDNLDLRVARLADRRATGNVSLAGLPVGHWEPTFDSAAVERGQLRMLLPLGRQRGPRSSAPAAVVTWPIVTLTST